MTRYVKIFGWLLVAVGAVGLFAAIVVGAGTGVRSAAAVAFGLGACALAVNEVVIVTKRKAHKDA